MNKKLAAAQKYRELGFNVIPTMENKKPFIKWEDLQQRKVVASDIDGWWQKYPDANPAIVTGAISNLTVLDIDTETGWKSFNELSENNAPIVNTPGGGKHVYFKFDSEITTGARKANEWDWRGEGGYVIAPPSTCNGKVYAWEESKHILKTPPPKIWDFIKAIAIQSDVVGTNLANSIYNNTSYKSNGVIKPHYNPITPHNKHNIIPVGQRDQTLFHLANVLVRGGMPHDNILYFLRMFWNNCCEKGSESYSEKELNDKLKSAFKRHTQVTMGDVRDWVAQQWGNISLTNYYIDNNSNNADKPKIRTYFHRLAQEGVIEREGTRSGEYRVVEKEIEPEDWLNASVETCDIDLPFDLGNMVHVMPGDIVLFSGVPGVGKTAVLLNTAIMNRDKFDVHYFSSELRPGTFKRRISKHDTMIPEMLKDIKFYQRYENYHDVIKSGKGNLNVIDYIKVLDNFYTIGKILANIAKKLDGAIAVVSLQKQFGATTGLGGMFSQFEPVLSINIDKGEGCAVATISKTKEYKEDYIEKFGTADGYEYHFKIVNGIKLVKNQYWHKPFKGE